MNTLDPMWFIPSVISKIESRASMVICLLTLCLHLPHSYKYTSGLLNFDFYTKSWLLFKSLSINLILCCYGKASILKICIV